MSGEKKGAIHQQFIIKVYPVNAKCEIYAFLKEEELSMKRWHN